MKRGDIVHDAKDNKFHELIDYQAVHNRYQVKGKSGWIYGVHDLTKIKPSTVETLRDEVVFLTNLKNGLSKTIDRLNAEIKEMSARKSLKKEDAK